MSATENQVPSLTPANEVAEINRMTWATLRRKIAAREIQYTRIGGRIYFTEAQILATREVQPVRTAS